MIKGSSMRGGGLRLALGISLTLAACQVVAPAAEAYPTLKKSLWGPTRDDGGSLFPLYRRLGAGIFQLPLSWNLVAARRPANPDDPMDPAYRWPPEIDYALTEAKHHGIRISLVVTGAPSWANGERPRSWAPENPRDFARFLATASRRYPGVAYWMVWNEPSKTSNFQPLVPAMKRRLTPAQRRGPRRYAEILDVSYRMLKRVDRSDFVIGGNTWSGGEVVPLNFLKAMRLANGRRPRMDLYGHNPFTLRIPKLGSGSFGYGYADFSELDSLARWLDRLGYRNARGRRLRLFLSEFTLPTDHANHEFNFWVTRATQAKWLAHALRITRRWRRIYTLGYLGLYDEPPRPDGLEVNRGLIDYAGRKKPAYWAFKRG